MGSETAIDWVAICCVIAAVCAVASAYVSVSIYRKAKTTDFGPQIAAGDAVVRAHVDTQLSSIDTKLDDLSDTVARIEQRQETESEHVLRPRDLGRMHEKVNAVALDLAAIRAQSTAENRALGEQMRVLQRLFERNYAGQQRSQE